MDVNTSPQRGLTQSYIVVMPRRSLPKGALRAVPDPPGGFAPELASLAWGLAVPAGLHPAPGSALWEAGHVSALAPLGAAETPPG